MKTYFFETQKAQSPQKGFHKSLLCLLGFKKDFCENLFVDFVPFVFQKNTFS